MRWSIARMLAFTAALAIALAIYYRFWYHPIFSDINWKTTRVALGGYIGLLSVASILSFKASPKWRSFWGTYSVLGWSYFLFVMRGGRLFETFASLEDALLGILVGFASAFLTLALSSSHKVSKDQEDK